MNNNGTPQQDRMEPGFRRYDYPDGRVLVVADGGCDMWCDGERIAVTRDSAEQAIKTLGLVPASR
jgi:hypothetical protein